MSVLIFCNSCNESLSCSRCEKMDLKIIQSLLGRVQIFYNFSEEQQTVEPFRTHEQLSLNKHTAVDHSDNNKVLGTNYGLGKLLTSNVCILWLHFILRFPCYGVSIHLSTE